MRISNSEKAPLISESRKKELLLFLDHNGLTFNDLSLLDNAFIHSSFANEAKGRMIKDNERLEFLGDSVLSVVIAQWLYDNLSVDEGVCSKIKSMVVSEVALSEVALLCHIDSCLMVGKGEEITGGRNKKAILADCMEAVFAALYLDQGLEVARSFILKNIEPIIQKVLDNSYNKDYKTALQQYVQKKYKKVPVYTLTGSTGPEHDPVFYYTVNVHGTVYGPATGPNKKVAEQNVAKLALEQLGCEI